MSSFSKPNLLASESATEFAALHSELEDLLQPSDVLERGFVDDLAELIWEILRSRRIRIGVIRGYFPTAIQNLYMQVFHDPDFLKAMSLEAHAAQMAANYFLDAKCKREFLKVLGQFGLGEDAIEAEAFRLAGVDLDRVDRMLSAAMARRNKVLRFIGRYRKSLASQIRAETDRMIAEREGSTPEAEGPCPEPSVAMADCGE
jgi:hypothetical protein